MSNKMAENKEKISRRLREHYAKNREKMCRAHTIRQRLIRKKRRILIINHYSNNQNECACCKTKSNLTVDHINGGGNRHVKEVGGPSNFYRWLVKNDFPVGFQVLCFECNLSKHGGDQCLIDHTVDKEKIRQDLSVSN